MSSTPLLDQVRLPADLRQLKKDQLQALADELRAETIRAVSHTGGHLGAGLGVVELTTALHYVFNTPEDILIWDVGHQAYPHKIITGRRDRIRTLRQAGGLSGFTRRSESIYDPFGAAHSSTSISAALGYAAARDQQHKNHHVIAVIGDGAMSAGMAYEAMNNAGAMKSRLIVVLNDNDMSIAPPVGAISNYLSRIVSSRPYRGLRGLAKKIASKFPKPLYRAAERAEEYARGMVTGGTLFEELGFYYIGPVDGHNLDALVPILENVRDSRDEGPVLIHVRTEKGRGFEPAKSAPDKCHAVNKFDVITGTQIKSAAKAPTFTKVYADSLIREAARDEKIIAITAAMPSGTGLDLFEKQFPARTYDVGIAEQHAVTFAAGMACDGMRPFVTIYSTFLQRAYDQVVHDVALQNLPVRFMMDRAGLVGADGATHAGAFDIAYLGCLPNFVLMAAADEAELSNMVHTAALYDNGPIALRYPRGEGFGVVIPEVPVQLEIGKGRVLRKPAPAQAGGNKIALLSYGARLQECLMAADELAKMGLSATVADARFAKPLDEDLLLNLARHHEVLLTIEEGSVGGFGVLCLHKLAARGALDHGLKIRTLTLPDVFQDHAPSDQQYADAGLDAAHIARTAAELIFADAALTNPASF